MKKIMLMIVCMFFLVGTISAATWDDKVNYDKKNREYTITNSFGLGDEIAKIKLITPYFNKVAPGYGKVAEITLINRGDWEEIFEEIELFYINKDGSYTEFERQVDYKFKIPYEKPVYKTQCRNELHINGSMFVTDCKDIQTGTELVYQWEDFDNSLGKDEEITIGLFTNVEYGDYVEWIPVIYGHRLDEWAVWSAALDVGLMAYYNFDNDTIADIELIDRTLQGNDGALTNMENADWVPGLLGFALDFDGADEFVSLGTLGYKPNQYSLSFWVNMDSHGGVVQAPILSVGAGGDITAWGIRFRDAGDNVEVHVSNGTLQQVGIVEDNNRARSWNATHFPVGIWTHVVAVVNATNITYYHNGTLTNAIPRTIPTVLGVAFNMTFARAGEIAANYFDGQIDEAGIWNRSLLEAEVTDLFNGGIGLLYPLPTPILVALVSPPNNTITTNRTNIFTCNVTSSLPVHNITFVLNGAVNETNVSGLNNTNYSFTKTLDYGNHNWSCSGENNESTQHNASIWEITIQQFSVNNEVFNISTHETQDETFVMNITTLPNIESISAYLNYNGTTYAGTSSCSGSICVITRTIDVPLMHGVGAYENKTFFWQITLFDGTSLSAVSENSSNQYQNVSRINFGECGPTTQAVNFSFFEETNQTVINANFEGTFSFYFGSGTVTKTNFTTNISTNRVEFCVDKSENYTVNSDIELSATGFSTRLFDFVEEIYNNASVTQKRLFLLNTSASSTIIIEVKNQGLVAMSGILVNISRFLPESGSYINVESQLTDDFGQFVAKLIENDAKYRFEFYDSDGTLLKTSPEITIACRSTICIIPFVIEIISDDFDDFDEIPSYSYELSFDNTTNTFVFSWDDRTGDDATTRLEVTRYLSNGSTVPCNISSTLSLDVLSCAVGSLEANYVAQVFRTVDGEERRITILAIEVGSPVSTYGLEGLLWVFLLLFTLIAIGAFNPTAGVALYCVGFIMLGTLGMISMPLSVFFANTLLCVIFIWSVNKK